ncbi:MAG TPA: LacI family DNA-binding transcriptional regulator [Streptosporangiaceae bacterium]|jgi:LacI family transcriptional regulator|nr:LacI family DNA-binding transcriptional regulator [Streptosporangiaceae bacterium]
MSTVYDVADLAGVSTATVSRVIHGSPLVHPDTQQRVRRAIDELGFVPDGSAQGLSRRRKDIIGLAALERGTDEIDIEQAGQLFVDEVVHAVESVLRGTECSLLLTFGQTGEQFQRRVWSLSGKVDGLLVAEEIMPASRLRSLAKRIPVVIIAGRPGERELDMVAVDNAAGIRALVAHLLGGHGYRRLGFLAGPADSPDAQERLAAFRQAIAGSDAHLAPVLSGDFSEASGAAAARALLGRGTLPEAVGCANDQMAIGAMREFQRAGIAVPGDVAVTGFDDIYASRIVTPAVTTVNQPLRDLGRKAAARLRARIDDHGLPPRTEILPTHLVIRASCGCPVR